MKMMQTATMASSTNETPIEKDKKIAPEKLNSEAARYAALRNHQIRFEDAIDPNAERVSNISKRDILFGRGKGYQNHPGNRRMRELIEKYKVSYHSLKRSKKRELVQSIYNELVEGGSRFLKKLNDEDAWVKVDEPVALQKVSHTLRCRKTLEKFEKNNMLAGDGGAAAGVAAGADKITDNQNRMLGMQGVMPNASLNMASAYNPLVSLEAQQRLGSFDPAMMGLEAERNAALDRYRALSGMSSVVPGSMAGTMSGLQPVGISQGLDSYNLMRQEQMARDYMLMRGYGMGGMGGMDPSLMPTALPTMQGMQGMQGNPMQGMSGMSGLGGNVNVNAGNRPEPIASTGESGNTDGAGN